MRVESQKLKHLITSFAVFKLNNLDRQSTSVDFVLILKLFHDGGRYHIETSALICRANQ